MVMDFPTTFTYSNLKLDKSVMTDQKFLRFRRCGKYGKPRRKRSGSDLCGSRRIRDCTSGKELRAFDKIELAPEKRRRLF